MATPQAESPNYTVLLARWVVLPLLLAGEFLALIGQIDAPQLSKSGGILAELVVNSREIWRAVLGGLIVTAIVLAPRLETIASAVRQAADQHRAPWALASHAMAFGGFLVVSKLAMARIAESGELSPALFLAWVGLGAGLITGWLLALAPLVFWRKLLVAEWRAGVIGVCIGIPAGAFLIHGGKAGVIKDGVWSWLAEPTLRLVHTILVWVYPDVIFRPDEFIIGTPYFIAEVGYLCSGYEGMLLVSVFLGVYVWLFRRDLRFPHIFILLPAGIAAMYLANAARIAVLVLIGTFVSRDVAVDGFHSQAGWINLSVVAYVIVFVSRRSRFFNRIAAAASVSTRRVPDLASALLVPFLALMAASMLIAAFSSDVQWLYPLKVIVLAPLLFYYRHAYAGLGWKLSWLGPVTGVVFLRFG